MSVSVPPVINHGQRVYGPMIVQGFASYSVYPMFPGISFAFRNSFPKGFLLIRRHRGEGLLRQDFGHLSQVREGHGDWYHDVVRHTVLTIVSKSKERYRIYPVQLHNTVFVVFGYNILVRVGLNVLVAEEISNTLVKQLALIWRLGPAYKAESER